MTTSDPRPGLAKIRAVPLYREERVVLLRSVAGRVRELVEGADVMSEGATREEDGRLVYYGSTSLLFAADRHGVPPNDLARLVRSDPHLRLMAIRVARRELGARVTDGIGTLSAELSVRVSGNAVSIDVDVVATLAGRKIAGA